MIRRRRTQSHRRIRSFLVIRPSLGELVSEDRDRIEGGVVRLGAMVNRCPAHPRSGRHPLGPGQTCYPPPSGALRRRARRHVLRGRRGARSAAPEPASPGRPAGTARRADRHRFVLIHRARGASCTSFNIGYPSPPASSGGLVVCSTWRVRRALHEIAHPQLPVITRSSRAAAGAASRTRRLVRAYIPYRSENAGRRDLLLANSNQAITLNWPNSGNTRSQGNS